MATLKEAIEAAKAYTGQPAAPTPAPAPPTTPDGPPRNTMIRSPLPTLWKSDPDSQRQFYINGQVPQNRFLTPVAPAANAGNVTENETVLVSGGTGGNSSGGTSSGISTTLTATQAAVVTTPALAAGASWVGQFSTISSAFQLITVASGTAARVQMYGSKVAQNQDAARGLDDPPQAGVMQNLVCDVALDTAPFLWNFQDRVGSNGEQPQTTIVYITITNLSNATAPVTVTIQYVPLGLVTTVNAVTTSNGTGSLNLANSSNIAYLTGAQFTGPISSQLINGGIVNVATAAGLQIGNDQIQSADLADSDNLAYLNQENTFTGTISAPVVSAQTSAGLQINGSQIASADLSDSTNIAYLNVSNTFSAPINAPVVSVNEASGLQVAGTQISSGSLSDASNLAYLNETNNFTGAINAPVVDVATSAGLTVAGTQLSSINLLDSGNLATLDGVNVFTNTVTAPTLNITGSAANVFTGPVTAASISSTGSAASVFTGPVESAQFTQAAGSTAVCTFNGTVNAATFSGAVETVNLTCTGGVVDFSGSGLTVTEINTFAPPAEGNADRTLNHVLIQSASVGTTTTFTSAELTSTGVSFTVTANSTSDVFDLDAQMLYSIVSREGTDANGAFLVALVDGVIGSQFGFGIDNVFYGLGPSVCNFRGNVTGLSPGTHTITLYYCAMILSGSTPGPINPSGYVTFANCTGSLQQISA